MRMLCGFLRKDKNAAHNRRGQCCQRERAPELRRGKVNDKLPIRNSGRTVLNIIVAALLGDKNMTGNFQAV
jgi:hypothetical protein